MNESSIEELDISTSELPARRVLSAGPALEIAPGVFSPEIRQRFDRLKDRALQKGIAPSDMLPIGVIRQDPVSGMTYEPCLLVPDAFLKVEEEIVTNELPGGAYLVVKIQKDPAVIGESLQYFYTRYVPSNQIAIDSARPTYEIYTENLLEYCVPVVNS